MKKQIFKPQTISLWGIVLSLFLIVNGCDKTEEVLHPDPYEVNDTREQASQLTMGDKIDAYMGKKDVDWFTFTPERVGNFDVTLIKVENHSDDLELKVGIYDDNGKEIGTKEGTNGESLDIYFSNPGGTYYLKITSRYGNNEGSYSLTVTDQNTNDAFEPNETKDEAYDLGTLPALDKKGELVNPHEKDWYKFTTSNNGVWDSVNLRLVNRSEDLELKLTLQDIDGNDIGSVGGGNGSNIEINMATKGGTYFALVETRYGNNTGGYTFSFQNRNLNDDNEPDDNFDQARVIDAFPTSDMKGTIVVDAANDNGGDYEFFKVTLHKDKKVLWTVAPEANNTELHFDVYGPDKTRLGGLDGGDGQTLQFYVNNTGTTETFFYIRLGGFIGNNGNYTISFTEEDANPPKGGSGVSL